MQLIVTVKTGVRENAVQQIDESHFTVSVTSQPIDGKANKAVLKILAKHLGVTQSCLEITQGRSSKIKKVRMV